MSSLPVLVGSFIICSSIYGFWFPLGIFKLEHKDEHRVSCYILYKIYGLTDYKKKQHYKHK
jgi:hypothetical protein